MTANLREHFCLAGHPPSAVPDEHAACGCGGATWDHPATESLLRVWFLRFETIELCGITHDGNVVRDVFQPPSNQCALTEEAVAAAETQKGVSAPAQGSGLTHLLDVKTRRAWTSPESCINRFGSCCDLSTKTRNCRC